MYRPLPTSAYTSAPRTGGSPGSAHSSNGTYLESKVVNAYEFRSCTHPLKSASVMLFGKLKTGCVGTRIFTGASSTVTRGFAFVGGVAGNGGSIRFAYSCCWYWTIIVPPRCM